MATVTFKSNRVGIGKLAVGPGARKAVLTEARKGQRVAVALAQQFRRTGQYASSFEVAADLVEIGGLPRAGARLANTAPHAAAVEVGNASTRGNGHHVLARTLDALRAG